MKSFETILLFSLENANQVFVSFFVKKLFGTTMMEFFSFWELLLLKYVF